MPDPSVPLPPDEQIEQALLAIAQRRGWGASACPSEVARQLRPKGWRDLMPSIRRVAAGLAQRGELDITQRGLPVAPTEPFKGPIRFRLKPPPSQKQL